MIVQLPKDALIISIEADPQSAEIARRIHEYADVSDRIKIVNEYTDKIIPRLSKDFNIDSFDLIFIDHHKDIYLRDLKLLEEVGLIKSGTMIVADNVITPGAPDYLEYVRNNPNYTTTFHEGKIEYRDDLCDGIEISIRK
jgi:catechol O-methyltransferase